MTMTNMSLFTIILIAVPTFVLMYPRETLQIIANLKRHLGQKLVQGHGKKAAKELARSFRSRALANGFDPELIEEVLKEHYGIVVQRLGEKRAAELLGEQIPQEGTGR